MNKQIKGYNGIVDQMNKMENFVNFNPCSNISTCTQMEKVDSNFVDDLLFRQNKRDIKYEKTFDGHLPFTLFDKDKAKYELDQNKFKKHIKKLQIRDIELIIAYDLYIKKYVNFKDIWFQLYHKLVDFDDYDKDLSGYFSKMNFEYKTKLLYYAIIASLGRKLEIEMSESDCDHITSYEAFFSSCDKKVLMEKYDLNYNLDDHDRDTVLQMVLSHLLYFFVIENSTWNNWNLSSDYDYLTMNQRICLLTDQISKNIRKLRIPTIFGYTTTSKNNYKLLEDFIADIRGQHNLNYMQNDHIIKSNVNMILNSEDRVLTSAIIGLMTINEAAKLAIEL